MDYTVYTFGDGNGKKDYWLYTKVYEVDTSKVIEDNIITVTINQDNPDIEDFKTSDKLILYRLRITDDRIYKYMIMNQLEYDDHDNDDKYCRLQYKVKSIVTRKFLQQSVDKTTLADIEDHLITLYESLKSTGELIIHEIK